MADCGVASSSDLKNIHIQVDPCSSNLCLLRVNCTWTQERAFENVQVQTDVESKGIGFVWGGQEICVWIELLDRKNRNKLGKKI